jgi:hypothetical protein
MDRDSLHVQIARIVNTPTLDAFDVADHILALVEPILRERDEALRQLRIGMGTERKALAQCVIAQASAEKAEESIAALTDELNAWRDAAEYDATMEGPKFKGWNRSQLDRARKISEALGPHPMKGAAEGGE